MKIISLSIFILTVRLMFSQNCFGQIVEFERDFRTLAIARFDTGGVNKMLKNYFSLLTPFNGINQLAMGMKGERWVRYPLSDFSASEIYRIEIDGLIDSYAPERRLLGYLMAVSAGDTSKKSKLLAKLDTEIVPGPNFWLGMGLMHLGCDRTSKLFRWMVKNNMNAGGMLFPMFTSLPADSLRNTAYQFANSEDWNERIYAVQMLSNTRYSASTDSILRKAIQEWPVNAKGYAIVPAQSLRIGKLLPLLEPFIDSSATRTVVLAALADSPTEADRVLVTDLADASNVDRDVLEALKKSRYPDMVKHWLRLLQSDHFPDNYYFSVTRDTVLKSDAFLPFVQQSLRSIKHPKALSQLLPSIDGRNDQISQDILLDLITHQDGSVRYYASEALKGTCSERLKTTLPMLLKSTEYCPERGFDLAIHCGLDSLQRLAENIYTSDVGEIKQANALNYLATYPGENSLKLFREAMTQNVYDSFMLRRLAAKGLGRLKDTASVETIIKFSEKERTGSDSNSVAYIQALGEIKGERSRHYISSFLNSENQYVKDMVKNILGNW